MAVDPGLSGTGWVIFRDNNKNFVLNGVINFRGKEFWDERAMNIAHALCNIAQSEDVNRIYCEYPAYFDSVAGQMVAKRGDLLKLTYLVGCIAGFLEPIPMILVPVNKWKGQLPKEVVKNRITNILGEKKCRVLKSHDWDACGIGLNAMGYFN